MKYKNNLKKSYFKELIALKFNKPDHQELEEQLLERKYKILGLSSMARQAVRFDVGDRLTEKQMEMDRAEQEWLEKPTESE